MTPSDVEQVDKYTDIFQIGARNAQNYFLLEEVGSTGKPVMLKRGLCMLIEEWLLAAEYVMAQGNPDVILCERGIRTFENQTRNTFDVSAVPVVQKISHLPVFVDPSHAAGKRAFVAPLSLAGVAAGADGLMIEVHPNPDHALSDGQQSLNFEEFADLDAAPRQSRKRGRPHGHHRGSTGLRLDGSKDNPPFRSRRPLRLLSHGTTERGLRPTNTAGTKIRALGSRRAEFVNMEIRGSILLFALLTSLRIS